MIHRTIKRTITLALLCCIANVSAATLENDAVILKIDEKNGTLSLQKKDHGSLLISDAGRTLLTHFGYKVSDVSPSGRTISNLQIIDKSDWKVVERNIRKETFSDNFGSGDVLIVRERGQNNIIAEFSYYLYKGKNTIVLMGLKVSNKSEKDFRLYGAAPLNSAKIKALDGYQHFCNLAGSSGGNENYVTDGSNALSINNLMVFGSSGKSRASVVAGGARYKDFLRWIETYENNGSIVLNILLADPSGKLIPSGSEYKSEDLSMISFNSNNPFEILEDYAAYFAKLNKIKLNYYDFPTLCGWAMSNAYGHSVNFNRSDLLVKEAKAIKATGFTKMTPVALRLEPDTYAWKDNGNTSQGWWDDAHLVKYNRLAAPYENFEKYCQGILAEDCLPFTYHQVNIPSRDFCRAHPDWVMNKDISKIDRQYKRYNIFMDYTHPGWREYYLNIWKRWDKAGLVGIKFDYPHSGWIKDGGFHDPYATTSSTYRQNFLLCREGLGRDGFLSERALQLWKNNIKEDESFEFQYIPSDLVFGVVDCQRTANDNSHIEPEMMSLIGLRWYKNRVMVNYYPDSKALHLVPAYLSEENKNKTISLRPAIRQNILSQIYFISGRLSLSSAISWLDDATRRDLSRVFPVLQTPKSPRPVDAFSCSEKNPHVYAYEVKPGWQQVLVVNSYYIGMSKAQRDKMFRESNKPREELFYKLNDDPKGIQKITFPLSGDQVSTGSLGLDPSSHYHVMDFWADEYLGCLSGKDSISSTLRSQESRVLSIREVKEHPQVISTDRHIMQGMFEVADLAWNATAKTFSGTADLMGSDSMTITIAGNGLIPVSVQSDRGDSKMLSYNKTTGLARISIVNSDSGKTKWEISFK